jgi:cytochrome c peroxidase
LQAYELSLRAPAPPPGSFDPAAAARGKVLFDGPAECSTCHVPPIFTQPGFNLVPPSAIGIDSFEADRSPTGMYRITPLAGLWTHQKGGFYHDGRFPTLLSVVQHYNAVFNLGLTPAEENDLVQYLLSI